MTNIDIELIESDSFEYASKAVDFLNNICSSRRGAYYQQNDLRSKNVRRKLIPEIYKYLSKNRKISYNLTKNILEKQLEESDAILANLNDWSDYYRLPEKDSLESYVEKIIQFAEEEVSILEDLTSLNNININLVVEPLNASEIRQSEPKQLKSNKLSK